MANGLKHQSESRKTSNIYRGKYEQIIWTSSTEGRDLSEGCSKKGGGKKK